MPPDHAIDFIWTLIAGFLVMFMQAGFALLETGLCRAKNAAHTMSMNLMVYVASAIGFFISGFAFLGGGANDMSGVSSGPPIGAPATLGLRGAPILDQMLSISIGGHRWGLMGLSGFCLCGTAYNPGVAVWFFYMLVFMDTAATIPTGACAERWKLKSLCLFSLCVGAFIYPIYACWMWGGGWLAQLGVHAGLGHGAVDFAGSATVHLQGGILAFVLCRALGPRIGKYDVQGKPRPIFGHHIPMVIAGTFFLAFGWFGFNAGSSLSGSSPRIGWIVVNTLLASVGGAAAAAAYMWRRFGAPDPTMVCTGLLGGLVAVTASCAFISAAEALLVGLIAGVLVVWSVLFLERRGIDDPVGAIGVHAVGGFWGIIAVGLFADGTFGDGYNGVAGNVEGLFHATHAFGQLCAQFIAAAACIGWNAVIGALLFKAIGRRVGNRVSAEVELMGLDIPETGAPGYSEFATKLS